MHAKDGMESLLAQEGEMGKGAERAITDEHISWVQRRMERRHLSHIVRVPGSREDFQEEACPRMKEGKQMGYREPTPWALPIGLAKVCLQFGRIGHRKTGAVDQECAVAPPPPLILGCLLADRRRPPQQSLPDSERQARPGLAKRRGRKALRDEVGQVATRRVAVPNLEDEEMDGGHRIEQARTPLVAHLVAQGENRRSVEQGSQLGLAVSKGFHDCAYRSGPPVCEQW